MARSLEQGLDRLWGGLVRFRRGPFREGAFTSSLHAERTAAWLGLALGVSFAICFLTGLLSHAIQNPPSWFLWPSRPAHLYRITQGLHVATGIAAVPLLLAKLWTVYPRLFAWPPVESVAHALERISLFPLVGGSVFLLVSGLNNIALWYPWDFFFPAAHYWASWITIGALTVHIGAKLPIIRRGLARVGRQDRPATAYPWRLHDREGGRAPREDVHPRAEDGRRSTATAGLTRRGFLGAVAASTAVVTIATVGQTMRPLRWASLLAPRHPAVGPQGFPVNKTARSAGVTTTAVDPAWRLTVEGAVQQPLSLSLDELRSFSQRTVRLPIACVEGWSATVTWTGVPLKDLLHEAGASPGAEVVAESLQPRGVYRRASINSVHAADRDTLVALAVNGEPLHLEHGFPARLIGPNRPGVMQTKWLSRLVVS